VTGTNRYRLNVLGDFYVEDGCCTNCGVPESEAPGLFGVDDHQCYVKKQPENSAELQQMLSVLHIQELGCIRYAGRDPNVLETIRIWRDLPIIDAPWWVRLRARFIGRSVDPKKT